MKTGILEKRLLLVSALVIVLLGLCLPLKAQELATLRVTIEDPSGAVLPQVQLTLVNTATGARRTAVTASNGLAVVAGLPAGSYTLSAKAQNFEEQTRPVQLSVGQTASVTMTLGIALSQEVNVEATAQGLDVEKSDVSQVIESRKILDLPVQGRDFIDFALLTPSVTVGRSTAVGAQSPFTETVLKLSFAGVRESHTSFIALDGMDYTTSISGVQRIPPSQDWVQEFRVLRSPYDADTGRSFGSVVNSITKSGTNEFHGSAYEFFRNDALNAKNLLSSPGFDTLRFNQFGVDVGGPIIPDKSFFFGGYEGQRRAESPLYSDFILNAIGGINAAKESLGLQPENLSSILKVEDYDKFIAKTNNLLNDSTTLNVSYLFNDQRKKNVLGAPPGEGLPSSFRDNPVRDQTIIASVIHTFSPTLTSDSGFEYGRRTFHLEPVGLGLEPAISIPNLLSGGGFVGSVRFYREQRLQFTENLTLTQGNHTFKFGGEAHQVWDDTEVPLFSPGFAIFSPESFFGLPPFPQPTALVFLFREPRDFFGKQIPARDPNFQAGLYAGPAGEDFRNSALLNYTHQIYGFYLQDQWKVRPNFTLSLGVRYDLETLPSASQLKLQGDSHPTDTNNIQPRVSFAYSFSDGKGVIRGGYGLFTAPFVFSDILVSWNGASEFTYMNNPLVPQLQDPQKSLIGFGDSGAVGVIPGPFTAGPAFAQFVHDGAYPAPDAPLLQFPLGYAQKDFPNAYAQQASLQIERQFGNGWFASIGYQFLHAIKMPVYESINAIPNGTLPDGRTQFRPADNRFGFVLMVAPTGYSIYHAGTVSVRRPFANHFSVLANYTWSKSLDIATTVNLPNTPQNYLRKDLERGLSDNDIRHRFTLAIVAEAPSQWKLLRDFKASILSTAQSARFFTINSGFDVNGDEFPFPDRVGLTGRNVYKGDPFFNLDLRIQRVIPFSDRIKGEFSAEFFNLFNVVNVQDVNHVYGAPDFVGAVPKEFGDGISGPVPSFGTPKVAAPARQIQFAFRLNF